MGRRIFAIIFGMILIVFMTGYGIITAYVNMNNTIGKEQVTVAEILRDGNDKAQLYFLGKPVAEFSVKKQEPPAWLWGVMPSGAKLLWYAVVKLDGYVTEKGGVTAFFP